MVIVPKKRKTSKSVESLAKEVNAGYWGKGAEIKRRLIQAGHDPMEILKKARELMS